jgi:ketosteroid isomerase-like protein
MSVVTRFYDAFTARDPAAMGACYADTATFSDPVFPDLDAAGVRAMWTMLLSRGSDLALTYEIVEETNEAARIKWIARYTMSSTGHRVENHVETLMDLKDDRIVRQVDDFVFWRWAKQALGWRGRLLGWAPTLRGKVQTQAARGLAAFRGRASQ